MSLLPFTLGKPKGTSRENGPVVFTATVGHTLLRKIAARKSIAFRRE